MAKKPVVAKEGLPETRWSRQKVTTYIGLDHIVRLREISHATQIPIGRLIDQALDEYFQEIGYKESPSVPPVDKEYIRQRLEGHRTDEDGRRESPHGSADR